MTTLDGELRFVLEVLSEVPRYMEVLVFLLGQDGTQHFDSSHYADSIKKSPQPHQLLENIRAIITVQYGAIFSTMLTTTTAQESWSALVSASFFQWKVTREDKFGLKTVGELKSQGIIFVEPINAKEYTYAAVFPLLLLTKLLQKNSWPMLSQDFNVKLSSNENGQNTLAILSMKYKGLRVMGRPITVNFLLSNYAAEPEWRLEPLTFEEITEIVLHRKEP